MKDHKLQDIRNLAVVGHASSGKTTLCEAMLATSGTIKRMGTIAGGNTVSDYHDDEREHQISIHSSLLRMEWLDVELNVVDAPGSPDFIGDALGALAVADFALIVVDAVSGVGFVTERMWAEADKLGHPEVHRPQWGGQGERRRSIGSSQEIKDILGARRCFP